jgi:hypothetical protein
MKVEFTLIRPGVTLQFEFGTFREGLDFINSWLTGATGGINSQWMPENVFISIKK